MPELFPATAPYSLGYNPVAPCRVAQMEYRLLVFSSAASNALCLTLCCWPSTQKRLPLEEALDSPLGDLPVGSQVVSVLPVGE